MNSGAPSAPQMFFQQPAPPPVREDPAVAEAARRQRVVEDGMDGRGSTLLAGAAQTDPTKRPLGARLLGNFGALG